MSRGLLRVYLGAAPGVGKTFAMLDEGLRRHGRGTDVVIGFVEDHGRQRTREHAEGLETIPRRIVHYRGAEFTELDLDAVLLRKPAVALIVLLAVFETAIAKMRVFRVPEFLGAALMLACSAHCCCSSRGASDETASPSTSPICSPAAWCWSAS